MSYKEVRKDWEILWAICPANDMTGAYVDSEDLSSMLETPTKKMAEQCMNRQIIYWLEQGIEDTIQTLDELLVRYPRIESIANKYGFDTTILIK